MMPVKENFSIADAINAQGRVVGGSGGFWPIVMSGTYNCRAFIYSQGHLQPLTENADDAASFEPFGINARGEIAGLHEYRAFYSAHGKLTILATLSHVPQGNRAAASGINAQGQIVGQSTINAGHQNPETVRRNSQGKLIVSSYYTGYYHHAVLWQRKGKRFVIRDLGTLSGHPNSEAEAINDKGWVVGSAETYDMYDNQRKIKSLAFLWQHGRMRALSAVPGAVQSVAYGLNNQGDIVGASGGKAVLWQQGKILDLNTVLPKNSGWILQEATAINNHGWIVGNGKFHGQVKAFLLKPEWPGQELG